MDLVAAAIIAVEIVTGVHFHDQRSKEKSRIFPGPARREARYARAPMLSERFRTAVERGHVDEAADLFSEDAVFRSPVLFKPYEGRDRVVKVLQAAERVLGLGGEFRYVEDPDERVAVLEFATVVERKQVEGVDILTFDDSGMITELKVMIRPASALELVGAKMAEEFPKVGLRIPD